MATFNNQQSWLPVENSSDSDCSLGLCTIYCPQWCYDLFTPPPHFSLTSNLKNRATAFSPLFIAIIGILATVLFLFTYYTLVTKLCGSFWFHINSSHHRSNPSGNYEEDEEDEEDEEERGSEDYHPESWYLSSSNGLDEALIRKITVCRYKRGEGLVEGTECSVCLSEFIEDESLRLLPKCCHAFHLQCIDTWLKSHSSCPLCRVNILLPSLVLEEENRGENRAASAAENESDSVVIDIENLDVERIEDEVKEMEKEGNVAKEFEVMEIAKDHHRLVHSGSSRRSRGRRKERGGRSRGLHYVMSPIRMKRSVSSGRSWLARQGRGRALFLPGRGKAI